ncbi:hypothetical protein OHA25_38930 [Nonomuraea sp. NBC_00507]|uniref:hypothetical protein n=1 Tax=Nonomuraea sp. NBC_00507 TaxID=2976002 RepID=UPI002E16F665
MVVAVVALRRPLAAAIGRVKHGVAVELAEVEQARESVEEELAQAQASDAAEVDALVKKAAELGWHLGRWGIGRVASDVRTDVIVDRSGERPVVRFAWVRDLTHDPEFAERWDELFPALRGFPSG